MGRAQRHKKSTIRRKRALKPDVEETSTGEINATKYALTNTANAGGTSDNDIAEEFGGEATSSRFGRTPWDLLAQLNPKDWLVYIIYLVAPLAMILFKFYHDTVSGNMNTLSDVFSSLKISGVYCGIVVIVFYLIFKIFLPNVRK